MRPNRENCLKAVKEARSIQGWLGDGEGAYLYNSAYYSNGDVLEIGGYMGRSTYLLASGMRDSIRERRHNNIHGVIITIDVHKKSFESDDILTPESILAMNKMINDKYLSRYIIQMIGWSNICIPLVDFYTVDTIFVDGGHRYETCHADLACVLSKIRHDRPVKIMVHDYHADDAPGIIKAVNELLAETPGYRFEQVIERTFVCTIDPRMVEHAL